MFISERLIVLVVASLFLGGCASRHSIMKGSIALKINETSGVACLYGENPQIGDKLELFENKCEERVRGKNGAVINCKMVKSGEASIKRLMNDHYAEFETTTNVKFAEGYTIEIIR